MDAPSGLRACSRCAWAWHPAEFPGPDGGKTAHYMLRGVATIGEKGPWSASMPAMRLAMAPGKEKK